ncbi:D-inositol-3-phosphate glycosyltransferase, partial [Mycobacterium sp. THU-M116]
ALGDLLRFVDSPRAEAMSRAAVAHASRFSWETTADALLASYRRAIGDFTGGRRRRGGALSSDRASARGPRRWVSRRGVGA